MTRTSLSVFDSPFLLGFERMQSLIDSAARGAGDAYPPYNVEAPEDGRLIISVAVAGFACLLSLVLASGRASRRR